LAHSSPNSVADRFLTACVRETGALPSDPSHIGMTPEELIIAQLSASGERLASARVASRHTKTAGEVRFIKDRGGDQNEWGWGSPGPSEREIDKGYEFKPKYLKPLAETLRSALMALGHVTSAHGRFVKVKSRNLSPDGNLGGKGYIQKIPDMRRQMMNCIEALSAFTDTVYDEIQAAHWDTDTAGGGNREREDVELIMDDAEEIKDDPEAWAKEEEEEMDDEVSHGPSPAPTKTASRMVQVDTDHDHISGLWAVEVHEGRRIVNVTGHIFTTERSARDEAKTIKGLAESGRYSVEDLARPYVQYNRSASTVAERFLRDSK
jgi:hypothetical protein